MRILAILLLTSLSCPCFSQSSITRTFQFIPSTYHREFSSTPAAVLRINAGDTVFTESVDATGTDKAGVRVTERGNPLTGPFYVEQAAPGDVLAITITSISLNRDYATTLNALIPKMLPKDIAKKTWRSAKLVKWHLDTLRMTGTADARYGILKGLTLPLHPFLGCVGVAPEGTKGMSSGGSGYWGGNLDFKYARTGTTVYLPVFHPGAMLFLGDGHAAQGDGELNGDALETSMRFSFTVQVIKQAASRLPTPMMEDSTYYMVFGIEKSLEESMKVSTIKLSNWLQQLYGFTTEEVSQVIGPAIEYRIAKVAASKVEVVAMIGKELFIDLKKRTAGTGIQQ